MTKIKKGVILSSFPKHIPPSKNIEYIKLVDAVQEVKKSKQLKYKYPDTLGPTYWWKEHKKLVRGSIDEDEDKFIYKPRKRKVRKKLIPLRKVVRRAKEPPKPRRMIRINDMEVL